MTQNTHPAPKIIPNENVVPLRASSAVQIKNFGACFAGNYVLSDISLDIPENGVTCIIGPSGAGKSTLLRALNRINEVNGEATISGSISILGRDSIDGYEDITELRRRVGMVFQTPCVFPRSIAENVLFGRRGHKLSKIEKAQIVKRSLSAASLWSEVKDRLDDSALALSLGQQQRLCIARALAMEPKVLLMDEPTASVDPISARAIEDLVVELSKTMTIIMVTHNIGQTKRIADTVVFLCAGELVEAGPNRDIFSRSSLDKTQTYLTEEFCDC